MPGESAVVIGGRNYWTMFTQMVKAAGAYPVIVSEPSELRREYARKSGADYVINPLEEDLESFVRGLIQWGPIMALMWWKPDDGKR